MKGIDLPKTVAEAPTAVTIATETATRLQKPDNKTHLPTFLSQKPPFLHPAPFTSHEPTASPQAKKKPTPQYPASTHERKHATISTRMQPCTEQTAPQTAPKPTKPPKRHNPPSPNQNPSLSRNSN
ncbi:hypothetical protein AOQ84DRAFT_131437 [Glonium stellatum]|uniref:Uncharacterized protein n=1 Tax=Glonium stellatum TaxID=574774 RepID=A0A8E2F9M1_9PEZI|nr:hypothetical protein AOQ84DRAFT_131437 [Glonium stellatum]